MASSYSPDLGEAESFSDDSSVDSRQTGSLPVSIYGQAMGHRSPHWIRVLRHAVDRSDEVKGEDAWRVLDSLQPDARAEVKRGIRSVRIHVVDARPYLARLRSIWRDAVGEARTWQQIENDARAGDKSAQLIRRVSETTAARLILLDSPVEKVRVEAFDSGLIAPFAAGNDGVEIGSSWIDDDLSVLGSGRKSLVQRVTDYTVKQAPLFITASERAREAYLEELSQLQFFSHRHRSRHLATALAERHRYDEGDEQTLRMMERHRTDIRETLREPSSWWARHSMDRESEVEPLTESTFDSTDTKYGQAADVAARFAAKWFEESGTELLANQFKYLTVNGERMSESEAEDYVQRWSDKVDGII